MNIIETNNSDLMARIEREKNAYNDTEIWVNRRKLHHIFRHVFSCQNTRKGEEYFYQVIREHAKNSVILDYGCFDGSLCPAFVRANAQKIVGIDISQKGIDEARKNYGGLGTFYCMDAHKTEFENDSFDFIVGKGVLHHLEYSVAIKEVLRILKPGGYALFQEPLADNPAAKLARMLSPGTRTRDENPLSGKQIKWADRLFDTHEHRFINFFSIPLGILSPYLFKNPDNVLLGTADFLDSVVARSFLRSWMRSVVLLWKKAR